MRASASAASSSRGSLTCDGYHARTNDTVSPSATSKSLTVVMRFAAQRDAALEAHAVRTGDGADTRVRLAHPRDDGAIVEANDELGAHRHAPAQPANDADDVRRPLSPLRASRQRHAVGDRDRALRRLERRVEDQRAGPVRARDALDGDAGCDEPAAVLGLAEQRGEARGRVEAGETEPVDGAIPPHEGGRLAVAEQRVVLDLQRHGTVAEQELCRRLIRPGQLGSAGEEVGSPPRSR